MLLAKDHLSHWRDEMVIAKARLTDEIKRDESAWFCAPEVEASVRQTVDLIAGVSSRVLMVDLLRLLDELEVNCRLYYTD